MRTVIYLLAALLMFGVFLANLRGTLLAESREHGEASSHRSNSNILKAVNSVAPPRDPQLLFLLMAQYSKRKAAGGRCRVFLRAAAGIRTSPDGRSKGPVS